ncbi:MAG: DUF4349 domain-containing protein [Tissierellia bacterium]|nr:DUF4349 domain-containing protein [Tissierellia bacterium]
MKKKMTIILIVVLLLTGCARKAPPQMMDQYTESIREGGGNKSWDMLTVEANEADMPMESPSAAYLPYEGAKIIRTLSYTLRTSRFDEDRQFITQLTAELGGYIENSYEYASGYDNRNFRNISLQLRIPSGRLDEFQTRFETDRTLNSKNLSQNDVTSTYVDVEERIKNLQARIVRYREMLNDADAMSDMIEIEQALSETTFELESYLSQKKSLDSRIDFSEVYIEMNEVADPLQVKSDESFIKRLQEGFVGGINGFIRGVQSIILFVVSNIFWLITIVGVIFLIRKLPPLKRPILKRQKQKIDVEDKKE